MIYRLRHLIFGLSALLLMVFNIREHKVLRLRVQNLESMLRRAEASTQDWGALTLQQQEGLDDLPRRFDDINRDMSEIQKWKEYAEYQLVELTALRRQLKGR